MSWWVVSANMLSDLPPRSSDSPVLRFVQAKDCSMLLLPSTCHKAHTSCERNLGRRGNRVKAGGTAGSSDTEPGHWTIWNIVQGRRPSISRWLSACLPCNGCNVLCRLCMSVRSAASFWSMQNKPVLTRSEHKCWFASMLEKTHVWSRPEDYASSPYKRGDFKILFPSKWWTILCEWHDISIDSQIPADFPIWWPRHFQKIGISNSG